MAVYKRRSSSLDDSNNRMQQIEQILHQQPGPDYYYWKDDLIKTNKPAFTFGKSERIKKLSFDDLDMKRDLDPNIDFVKKRAPGAMILQEHAHK